MAIKIKKGVTCAEWIGDNLLIHWFGIRADADDTGAIWRNGRLIFEGLSQSKGWKLDEKPSAEKALEMIYAWQREG